MGLHGNCLKNRPAKPLTLFFIFFPLMGIFLQLPTKVAVEKNWHTSSVEMWVREDAGKQVWRHKPSTEEAKAGAS